MAHQSRCQRGRGANNVSGHVVPEPRAGGGDLGVIIAPYVEIKDGAGDYMRPLAAYFDFDS